MVVGNLLHSSEKRKMKKKKYRVYLQLASSKPIERGSLHEEQGDNSLLAFCISAYLVSRGTDCFCSGQSFQGRLCNE